MIASIEGKIIDKTTDTVVVEAGGLGYEVFTTTHDLGTLRVGDEARLFIHDHIREDSHNLYGFSTSDAKMMFVQLLSISGIGPKVAMAILSASTIANLRQAIATGDPDLLKGVSGVGKKTAERIIIELRGKISGSQAGLGITTGDPVYQALVGLGYTPAQAAQAAASVPVEIEGEQERIKSALKAVK